MTVRSVSASVSRLLELLELDQPRVVTRDDLERLARDSGVGWPGEVALQRLRERGWLLDLKTRGVWEFAPAARAGAYGAGDPLIELRATLARRPDAPFAVAAESAAYLLGYASRRPHPDVVSAPRGVTLPPALRQYRVVRWVAHVQLAEHDKLPVWPPSSLVAFMATRPSRYHDWPNVGEWLSRAAAATTVDDLHRELDDRARSAWARAAYLMDIGGQAERAREILASAPSGSGPYYLGPRDRAGRHAQAFDVIDSTGMEIRSA